MGFNFFLFSCQAEKEEQAAIQHAAEEQQPATQYASEWGGTTEPQTEVSDATICFSKGSLSIFSLFATKA